MATCCSRAPPHNGRDFVEWLQQLVSPMRDHQTGAELYHINKAIRPVKQKPGLLTPSRGRPPRPLNYQLLL
eukprot:1195274-Prorocentrum_minimum.AAC.9